MQKPDYSLKSKAISQNYHVIERKLNKARFNALQSNDFEAYDKLNANYLALCNDTLFQEAIKINNASYRRRKRLSLRIKKLLSSSAYFVTLTFTDDVLQTTSADTRRRYVSRFLKAYFTDYIANIDFGSINGREHYHAVVIGDTTNMSSWDKYGFSHIQAIRSIEDNDKLAKYICKLTNHAIKETTKQQRLIYSRESV